jgi:hypothetical protein
MRRAMSSSTTSSWTCSAPGVFEPSGMIVETLDNVSWTAADAYYEQVVTAIAVIARESQVVLVDRYDAMRKLQRERGDTFYLSADNLHMNDGGYRCLSEQLAATIIKVLPQSAGSLAENLCALGGGKISPRGPTPFLPSKSIELFAACN